MTPTETSRTWDQADAPAAVELGRRFEAAWLAANPNQRPDPRDFLPENPSLRPGVTLALLRVELGLRFEAGEPVRVEDLRQRFPELDRDALIALVYEEFCLREEAGRPPEPDELEARFPELASGLRRVLDVHSLVGGCSSTATHPAEERGPSPFPSVGQTIAGFRLVQEIGRGSFARVFRAQERQLADRDVALKVSRTGSREPQALARLSHTHIVPVYSYRTDPATGLHLLCMPFLGGLSLAKLLADPEVQHARSGAELVAALAKRAPYDSRWGRPVGRIELARRGWAEAIAWWGARMAEALQHAHDRGVLHRDVKPSNVLITPDALPMLLDFNLAHQPLAPGDPPDALGGTLAYMAPEQLRGLRGAETVTIDGRADVYALGIVLYEALSGQRPFTTPREAQTVDEALDRVIAGRLAGARPIRDEFPEVPVAFEAVLRRCLEPDPARRYARAADLAEDLQAVADDAPLQHAREPWVSQGQRFVRRRRRELVLAAAVAGLIAAGLQALWTAERVRERTRAEAQEWLLRAETSEAEGRLDRAIEQVDEAVRLTESLDPRSEAARQARGRRRELAETRAAIDRAETFSRDAEPIRARLLDPDTDIAALRMPLVHLLRPFYVLRNPRWYELDELDLLDDDDRQRIVEQIDDLLFLWAVAARRRSGVSDLDDRLIRDLHDRAVPDESSRVYWRPLIQIQNASSDDDLMKESGPPRLALRWALLAELAGRNDLALARLRQAAEAQPGDAWIRYALAVRLHRDGRRDEARLQAEAVVALRPTSAWALALRDLIATGP